VIKVICPSCGVPFFRHGAVSSSHFYRTHEENQTCVICREHLDPQTLLPKNDGQPADWAGSQGTPLWN
jgi:competence CoiA-like predicted nuclease